MNLNISGLGSGTNPFAPTYEELLHTGSISDFRILYKNKYLKDFASDDDLIRQITRDWAAAAEKVFCATEMDSRLKDTELFREVTVEGTTYRLIGIMHDAPVDESVQVARSKEKFLEIIRTEHQNSRFTKGLAQVDLEDIVAATDGCKAIYAEDNFDEYFAECGLRNFSKRLIPLNDSEIIFAALMPQVALSSSPLIDGLFSRGLLGLLTSRKDRSIDCIDIPELDIDKIIRYRRLSSKDPAHISIASGSKVGLGQTQTESGLSAVESPGIILINEFFGAESKAEATHFLARLPMDLFYGHLVTQIPGLKCAPPFGLSDEMTKRDNLKQFSTTLRSALMALTLRKLGEREKDSSKVAVLLGRGHAAEVAFYLANPPKSEPLDRLAELCATNILKNDRSSSSVELKNHAQSRIARYRRFAAGYLSSIGLETLATLILAVWTAKKVMDQS